MDTYDEFQDLRCCFCLLNPTSKHGRDVLQITDVPGKCGRATEGGQQGAIGL